MQASEVLVNHGKSDYTPTRLESLLGGLELPHPGLIEVIIPPGHEDKVGAFISDQCPMDQGIWFSVTPSLSSRGPDYRYTCVEGGDAPISKLTALLDAAPPLLIIDGLDSLCGDISGSANSFMNGSSQLLWPLLHLIHQTTRKGSCIIILSISYSGGVRAGGNDLNSLADYQLLLNTNRWLSSQHRRVDQLALIKTANPYSMVSSIPIE